jgi:hypothetical protein
MKLAEAPMRISSWCSADAQHRRRCVMNATGLIKMFKQRFGRVIVRLHNGLAIVGLIAVLLLVAHGGKLIAFPLTGSNSVFGTIRYDGDSLFTAAEGSSNPRYKALASFLARRYRVANEATVQLVEAAHDAGQLVGLDPLIILSVMAIESRLNPIAESVMGARGLMQVMPRQHQDKLAEHGGADAVLDPNTNILIGARILKDCIRRAGSLEAGLQLYAGALADLSNQYAIRVMAEKERLDHALRRMDRQTSRAG